MIRTTALFALAFSLAACGGSEPEEPVTTIDLEGAEEPTSNPLIERFDNVLVVVEASGLRPHEGELFAFGEDRATVDAALTQAYGSEPELGENAECGAGPMQFSTYGPLKVAYQNDKLAGWFLRPGEGVVTRDGIQPGTTTMDGLKGERQLREIDSTLPGEFEYTSADYGTIRGFSEGQDITALQAGLSCFFR